ncbi:iron-sulfur protein [Streptomyces sp. NRRL F-4489]|uniref:PDR/VanB family oxidoreductase n=1 Tax=Streptomyces sp. NRRL F-4489 TaxID=1609095 RepID=UPI00074B15EF|nr:PDR/VanB family oxidoreductase [Streptomyces sp. NRRL F-4489]KUL38733.1 iron-sulfur protein [Streptomyces sp. NRRL F-4489]
MPASVRTPRPAGRGAARLGTALAVAGTALPVRRALRRRIRRSPLWPLPALEQPVSGQGRAAARPAGLRLRVAERTEAAQGVVALRLEGARLPAWEPGAHLDLVLPSGAVRPYSLCGEPADALRTDGGSYTVAVRLVEDGRGGSREVHEALRAGTTVEVRGPRNRFPLEDHHAYLFLAGGIGITPILPMVRRAEAEGVPWRLLYAGRSRASMPFLAEVEKLAGGADGERLTVVAEDEDGRPDLAAALAAAPPHAAVYCCGPGPMMDAVAALLPQGAEGLALYTERFTASTGGDGPATGTPAGPATGNEPHAHGPSDDVPHATDEPFEVELRRTARTVTVPAGTSVLRAIREQALPDLPYSCEQGFCGTCQQRVLAGEVDHRDELLTDAERGDSLLICVSRAKPGTGGLVLDL